MLECALVNSARAEIAAQFALIAFKAAPFKTRFKMYKSILKGIDLKVDGQTSSLSALQALLQQYCKQLILQVVLQATLHQY